MQLTDTCLKPGCGGAVKARGLCSSCYLSAARLVRRGRATWLGLIKSGKARGLKKDRSDGTLAWLLDNSPGQQGIILGEAVHE